MAEKQECSATTASDMEMGRDEYDSDSDDEWNEVPVGEFMSPEMARILAQSRATKKEPILYVDHAAKTASRPRSRSG